MWTHRRDVRPPPVGDVQAASCGFPDQRHRVVCGLMGSAEGGIWCEEMVGLAGQDVWGASVVEFFEP